MIAFRTQEEKKSLAITTALFVIMLLILSISTFPPKAMQLEGGGGGGDMAMNFGFTDYGSGDNYESLLPVALEAQPVETITEEAEILTQNSEDAVVISNTKKEEKKPETKKAETPKEKQPDKSVTDALSNLMNNKGDGNTGKTGNQGSASGSLNNQGYDGSGGSGTGSGGGHGSGQGLGTGSGYGTGSGSGSGSGTGNYTLAGRKAVALPKPQYNCNEEGTVVVDISVDRTGKVIVAKAGRGTTNMAKCLTDVAEKAALQAKFDPSTTASEKQVGTITYNFKLGE
ncbi:MAG: energy transducer TonB [Flavobacteriaceae bacterium]